MPEAPTPTPAVPSSAASGRRVAHMEHGALPDYARLFSNRWFPGLAPNSTQLLGR